MAALAALAACTTPLSAPDRSPGARSDASIAAPDPAPGTTPASATAIVRAWLPARVLLLGEQHDAPEHQQAEREVVQMLAAADRLHALLLEMADDGHGTDGLPRDATDEAVRSALRWNERGWPWAAYGPVVMAAVRAGVPVRGANLPREGNGAAMRDTTLDARLTPEALAVQRRAIEDGHCGLLPASQIAPMTRIQIARDRRMAEAIVREAARAEPGRTVLLVAGWGHVVRDRGVPAHLGDIAGTPSFAQDARVIVMQAGSADPLAMAADAVVLTPPRPPQDHCAALRGGAGPLR